MRGQIRRQKNGSSWTVIVSMGKDPQTGKYRQHWEAVPGTKPEAERRLTEILHLLDKGTVLRPGKVTVAEFFDWWLANYAAESVRRRTFEGYFQKVKHNVIPALGKVRLAKLQPAHLKAFYSELLRAGRANGGGGLSPQTIRQIHRIVSRALTDAVELKLVEHNIAKDVRPPKANRKEMRALDGGELAMFLAEANRTEYGPLFELDAYTGLRRSEILGLRWGNIDLTLCSLSVSRGMHVLKDRSVIFTEPKAARSRRSVALTPRVALMLADYKERQEAAMKVLGHTLSDNDPVFTFADGSPMLPDGISRVFKKIARLCGLADVRMHDLRHTHCALLLRQGIPINVVSQRLGHGNVSTTLNTYAHLLPGQEEQAALAFEEAMARTDRGKVAAPNHS